MKNRGLEDPKGTKMTIEKTILDEGVILNEMGIEEIEEVVAPGILLGD